MAATGNCLEQAVISNLSSFNLFFVFCAYLIGAIPTGFIVCRLYGVADIRLHGSGNIGATNVSRVLGAPFFFIVLLCDVFKSCTMMIFAQMYAVPLAFVMSALLLGNCYSPFLQGNGGKGVATFLGILVALSYFLAALFCTVWACVFCITKQAFIASLIAAFVMTLYAWIYDFFAFSFTAILIVLIIRHRSNIDRFF